MPWPKGKSKPKTGGRKAGVPNKRTGELSQRIEELLGGQDLPQAILSRIKKLSLERQAEFLMELMPYVYPRRKAAEIKTENKTVTFADLMLAAHNYEQKREKELAASDSSKTGSF